MTRNGVGAEESRNTGTCDSRTPCPRSLPPRPYGQTEAGAQGWQRYPG